MRKCKGYTITFCGEHDGRERWSVECSCGWWDARRITRATAQQALREHREQVAGWKR